MPFFEPQNANFINNIPVNTNGITNNESIVYSNGVFVPSGITGGTSVSGNFLPISGGSMTGQIEMNLNKVDLNGSYLQADSSHDLNIIGDNNLNIEAQTGISISADGGDISIDAGRGEISFNTQEGVDFMQTSVHNFCPEGLSTPPSGPAQGQIYYSTRNNLLYYFNNSVFVPLQASGNFLPVSGGILLGNLNFNNNNIVGLNKIATNGGDFNITDNNSNLAFFIAGSTPGIVENNGLWLNTQENSFLTCDTLGNIAFSVPNGQLNILQDGSLSNNAGGFFGGQIVATSGAFSQIVRGRTFQSLNYKSNSIITVDVKNGNDSNGDGTLLSPFATIAKAVTLAASGNSIYLFPGIYNEKVALPNYVSLIGAGQEISILTNNTEAPATLAVGNGCTVQNLTINSGKPSASGVLFGVGVALDSNGVATAASGHATSVLIENVTLYGNYDCFNPGGFTSLPLGFSWNGPYYWKFKNCSFNTACWSCYDQAGLNIDYYDCDWVYTVTNNRPLATTPGYSAVVVGTNNSKQRIFGGSITANDPTPSGGFSECVGVIIGQGLTNSSAEVYGTNINISGPITTSGTQAAFANIAGIGLTNATLPSGTILIGAGTTYNPLLLYPTNKVTGYTFSPPILSLASGIINNIPYLPLSGGTINGKLIVPYASGNFIGTFSGVLVPTPTSNITINTNLPMYSGGVGNTFTLGLPQASASSSGYLSSSDWTTFNNKLSNVVLNSSGTLFLTPVVNSTTNGIETLTMNLVSQTSGTFLSGPNISTSGVPIFKQIGVADLPNLSGIYLPLKGGNLTGELKITAASGPALYMSAAANVASPSLVFDAANTANASFDIGTALSTQALRIYGGNFYNTGPAFQIWPTSSTFQGMYFDAGSLTGADIFFRNAAAGGAVVLCIKQGTNHVLVNNTTDNGTDQLQVTGTASITTSLKLSSSQTVVSGSVSGTATFSQPFQGTSHKKVIVYCASLNGTATYNFPTAFTNTPVALSNATLISSISTSSVTITGTVSTGFIIIEGY